MQKTNFRISAGISCLWILLSCSMLSGQTRDSRPNIIIIYADDLGYGDLSSYGGNIPTPHIDRIGKEGIRFTDFYVSAPACTPSRYSLLTGAYPQRSRHGLTKALMPPDTNYLDTSEKILPAYLKDRGYITAMMGKWHLGFRDSNGLPFMHGFDVFSGFRGGCIDFFDHVYGQLGHDWYVNGKPLREKGYSTDLITGHALDFIEGVKEKQAPFFLYLPYNAPHYGKTDPERIPENTVSLSEGTYRGTG
ncbi:MAG TPA: sulfatase-like hydrolase/transferase, partial [Anseongella sp.]|nr:sulfatase-like hydrolase/transferase [Anseongella sp.]